MKDYINRMNQMDSEIEYQESLRKANTFAFVFCSIIGFVLAIAL